MSRPRDIWPPGEVTQVTKIRRRLPVEEYLQPQRRFAHLFGAKGRTDLLARIQAEPRWVHPYQLMPGHPLPQRS